MLLSWAIILSYLLICKWKDQQEGVADFIKAWETGSYEVNKISSKMFVDGGFYIVLFPSDTAREKVVKVSLTGVVISSITSRGIRPVEKPNRYVRKMIEPLTTQIAVMYKIEHGGL